jgi:hypothetical protein
LSRPLSTCVVAVASAIYPSMCMEDHQDHPDGSAAYMYTYTYTACKRVYV